MRFMQFANRFHQEESGQDLLEYALVLLAIALAAVVGSSSLASTITSAIGQLNTRISTIVS
ncbi:MAG: Flp family type IVb pilin [Acidobacteriia bacterium]|nr:Flp family type IVb pilin [Terriglobia bacterium]